MAQVYLLRDAEDVILARATWCFGLDGDREVYVNDEEDVDLLTFEGVSFELDRGEVLERLRGDLYITLERPTGGEALRWWFYDTQRLTQRHDPITLSGHLERSDPESYAHALCRQWCDTWPDARNLWRDQPMHIKRAWTRAALKMIPFGLEEPPAGEVYTLDGRYIVDYPSLFLALGEAFRGPGGYAGSDLHGLGDCFCGGFGMRAPCTLRWTAPHVARHHLTAEARALHLIERSSHNDDLAEVLGWSGEDLSLWDEVLEQLARSGVEVVLEEDPTRCDGSVGEAPDA